MNRFLVTTLWFIMCAPDLAFSDTKEITYFVVDASGSMRGRESVNPQAEAADILEAEIGQMLKGQWAAVTYFGLSPEGIGSYQPCLMEQPNKIPPFQGVENIPPFPALGGSEVKTSIGAALSNVLSAASDDAKVVLITDGGEECDSDFAAIRNNYPRVEFDIRQVGADRNIALDVLNAPASRPEILTPEGRPIEVNVHFDAPQTRGGIAFSPGLKGWYEKRLWLFGLLATSLSAWFLGSSLGKAANRYENESKSIERQRKAILDSSESLEDVLENNVPPEIDHKEAMREGRVDRLRSIISIFIAGTLVLPLIFIEWSYPPIVSKSAYIILALVFLVFVLRPYFLPVNNNPVRNSNPLDQASPTKHDFLTVLGLSVGLVMSASAFWVEPKNAISSAWFFLSSEFSAAMSIISSAPLLFVGSKWWQLESAKSNYLYTYTEAISEKVREKRREEKRDRDEWNSLIMLPFSWKPKLDLSFRRQALSRLSRETLVKRAHELIIERLKTVAHSAGSAAYSPEASKLLQYFNAAENLEDRVRVLLMDPLSKGQMNPQEKWAELADELERARLETNRIAKDEKIASALITMHQALAN